MFGSLSSVHKHQLLITGLKLVMHAEDCLFDTSRTEGIQTPRDINDASIKTTIRTSLHK